MTASIIRWDVDRTEGRLRRAGWSWWTADGVMRLYRRDRRGMARECVHVDLRGLSVVQARQAIESAVCVAMQRPAQRQVAGEAQAIRTDVRFKGQYPTIWEYLTTCKYDDGSARRPSSLLLFMQDGCIKGMIADKDLGQCLWVAGQGVFEVLAALEAGLLDPQAVWRQDRSDGGTAKRVTAKRA